jgi:hypothetical protein
MTLDAYRVWHTFRDTQRGFFTKYLHISYAVDKGTVLLRMLCNHHREVPTYYSL